NALQTVLFRKSLYLRERLIPVQIGIVDQRITRPPETQRVYVREIKWVRAHRREKTTQCQDHGQRGHEPCGVRSGMSKLFYHPRQRSQQQDEQNQRNAEMPNADVQPAQQTKTCKNN